MIVGDPTSVMDDVAFKASEMDEVDFAPPRLLLHLNAIIMRERETEEAVSPRVHVLPLNENGMCFPEASHLKALYFSDQADTISIFRGLLCKIREK